MRFAYSLTISLSTLVVACAGQPVPAGTGNFPTQAWECDRTGYVVSTADRNATSIWVFLPSESIKLEPATQPGVYSSADISLSISGMNASLDIAGVKENCQENRQLSVQETAKFRGVDFIAVGQEPPWRLEIGNDMLLMKTGYEQTRYEFPLSEPASDTSSRTTRYTSGNTGNQTLTVLIEGKPCKDSMSGLPYSATVFVTLDNKTYRGCGKALH
ncbi:MAG: COG3650 family protein [Gammaproteobacteria bacterium]